LTGFQLRQIEVTGPGVEPASVTFKAGLNVISGASDTGKSYLVEAIDFLLGGGTPPRSIPESRGYDSAKLIIEASDGKVFELARALQGGDFLLAERKEGADAAPTALGPRHSAGAADNISSFLLRLVGLPNKRVRKNAQNELQNLSFRNLAHLVMVDEEAIIKKGSPVYSGESTQRTAQAGVFKLLLTGQDDSALIAAKKPAIAKAELSANLDLLDQLLVEYTDELNELTTDPSALDDQRTRLNSSIKTSDEALTRERSQFEAQEQARQLAWVSRDEARTRYAEVGALLERFELLDQHYGSDLQRLEAVAEAGYFFAALEAGQCPLCGAKAGDHSHPEQEFDGDIETVRTACDGEIRKVRQLREELLLTTNDLAAEQVSLRQMHRDAGAAYKAADALLREQLSPALSSARGGHNRLLEELQRLLSAISLRDRVADLQSRRDALARDLAAAGGGKDERQGLPPGAVKSFSAKVEALLGDWSFPHEKPVFFDEKSHDLVLGSRRRGEQGKGLRALTHAAFSIALQQVCREESRPTVGFVLLDSPLVTFREADSEEAGLDAGSRLEVKQAFYRSVARCAGPDQVIIFENEDPDPSLAGQMNAEIFTKRANQGRAGFFPLRPAEPISLADDLIG
jgi:hypothetical protein